MEKWLTIEALFKLEGAMIVQRYCEKCLSSARALTHSGKQSMMNEKETGRYIEVCFIVLEPFANSP